MAYDEIEIVPSRADNDLGLQKPCSAESHEPKSDDFREYS